MVRTLVPRHNGFVPFEKKETEQSIPERFEEQVEKFPERLAVKTSHAAVTYDTLNRFANRVAKSILQHLGDGQEEPCVLLLEQGVPLVAAILGTLKAGKIYLPIDSHQPIASNVGVVRESGASLIITDSRNLHKAQRIREGDIKILDIRKVEEADDRSEYNPKTVLPNTPAYIFYTSGTTGQRKGVIDCHQNILHNIMRYTNSLGIHKNDKLTLVQSCSFSGSVSSLFAALLNGACVFPIDLHRDGLNHLVETMQKEDITIYHSVPSLFRHVASQGKGFPALRLIRLEGDQATLKDVELYRKNFADDCILVNGFGATECGIIRQFFIDKSTTLVTSTVPIGFEVQDMETLVIDDRGFPVPTNTIGEMAIKSQYLATGYWQNDNLTAKAFSRVDVSGLRLYRTGDLARISDEGCLEHLGRKDSQVKIRGFRVDMADIEVVLGRHPGVNDCVVSSFEEADGEKNLVAYFVPSSNPLPTDQEFRRFLKLELPEYYLPRWFLPFEQIPLTANGKVDRSALQAPGRARLNMAKPFESPYSHIECLISEIWQGLLEVERVGVYDNFFDLGGNSLLSIQFVDRLEKKIKVRINPQDVIAQTLGQIAIVCEEIIRVCGVSEPICPAQNSEEIEPFYFGPPTMPLFGCYHIPKSQSNRNCAVVFCYPMGDEYIRFHRAYRKLGDYLAQKGFAVLRFDFYGCGDSSGDWEQGQIDQWLADISLAIAEIKQRSGLQKICLVGLRLGGTLAMMAGEIQGDIDGIVLLDPVVNGAAYLHELKTLHKGMLRYAHVQTRLGPRREQLTEILGFAFTDHILTAIEKINLLNIRQKPADNILVIESNEKACQAELVDHLKRIGAHLTYQQRPSPQLWRWEEALGEIRVPHNTLQSVISWIAKEYS